MSTAITASQIERNPELLAQTVVAIGGSAGVGLETARRASAEGAKLILTGRSPELLQRAASEVHVTRRGVECGLAIGNRRVDMKQVKARKDAASARSNKGMEEWLREYPRVPSEDSNYAF